MVNNGQFSQIREVVLNKVLRILHNNEALNEFLCWDELIDSTCCPRYINKDEMSPRQIGNSFYFKVGHVFKEICRRQSFLVSNLFQTRTSHFVWKSHKKYKKCDIISKRCPLYKSDKTITKSVRRCHISGHVLYDCKATHRSLLNRIFDIFLCIIHLFQTI